MTLLEANPALDAFDQIWMCDFEFHQPSGEIPSPICLVAQELRTKRVLRLHGEDLLALREAPFSTGASSLMVAYFASAELNCFVSLGWPLPERVLDLYVEFRLLTSGRTVPCGHGLLGALAFFGLDGLAAHEKQDMQALAIRGGPFTELERAALLTYCESDVRALSQLLPAMMPTIDLPRAILRGRYMCAVARMEQTGVPIDCLLLEELREHWQAIQSDLVRRVDSAYGVFVPTDQRPIDPQSVLGAQLLRTADEHGIDPHRLASAVDYLYERERETRAELTAAFLAARKDARITQRQIERWENQGHDCSTWPHWDTTARTICGRYPQLGLGRGYEQDAGYDDADYGQRLWDLLRGGLPVAKTKRDLVPDAAQLLMDSRADEEPGASRFRFSSARFAQWLARQGIPWPRLPSGALALDDDSFRQMARSHPAVAPLRELRHALSQLRLSDLAVGRDGRNRCLMSPFGSRTGRNQPSNSRFIFGPSVWLRGLIRPEPGRALAYVDWSQQEHGIAAALSGDEAMKEAYASGDPYLTFAKQAKMVPADATKSSHSTERERCKICILGIQYGMGSASLAQSLGQPEPFARELLRLHREAYPRFWSWSQAAVDHGMLLGWLATVFGWRVHVDGSVNARSLANFPMQANGAEMMRLACSLATERGIAVCAPIHDALLVEGSLEAIDDVVGATQLAMREASKVVLDGFPLRSEAKVVRYPDRYQDPRGERMWQVVNDLLAEINLRTNAEVTSASMRMYLRTDEDPIPYCSSL